MIDLFIARDLSGQYWLFNQMPYMMDGEWVSDNREQLYVGTHVDVYLEKGEAKRLVQADFETD